MILSSELSAACRLLCVATCLMLAGASTPGADLSSSCPIPAGTSHLRYSRPHQIPTVAARDDPSHTIVTPGGMVLSAPQMVLATDVLTVAARDGDVLCFHLLTLARERHRCEVEGVARKEAENAYLFSDDGVTVRFTFTPEDQVIVEPLGTGYRSRCEPSGKIETAIYR